MQISSTHGFGAEADAHKARHSRVRTAIAVGVVAWVGLAAALIGSNWPIFWGISGLATGALSLAFYAHSLFGGRQLPRQLARFWPAVGAIAALGLYQLVQIVPLGAITGLPMLQVPAGAETLVSDTLSLAPNTTLLAFIRTATYAALFILLVQLTANRSRAQLVARGLFLVVALHAGYGLIALTQLGDTFLLAPKIAYLGSATGTFVNRNSFATFLAIGCTLGVSLTIQDAFRGGAAPWRINSGVLFDAMGVVVIGTTLVATQSRAGAFAGLCGTVFAAALLLAPRMRLGRFVTIIALSVPVLLVLLFFLHGEGLLDRLGAQGLSSNSRLELYRQVVGMIFTRPFLGFGGGAFETAFTLFHEPSLSPEVRWDHAHSSYLTLWAEYGLVMGSLPMLALGFLGWKAWRRIGGELPRAELAAAALGSLLVVAIHSLVDFSLEIHAVALLFVTVLALGVSGRTERGSR